MNEALPNAQEIEQEILGGLILGEISIDETALELSDQDFYSPKNRQIFQAIMSLEEVSLPSLISRLREWDCLERSGGLTYITTLEEGFVHGGKVKNNIQVLHEKRRLRQAIEICQRFDAAARNGGADLSEAIERLTALSKIQPSGSGSWDSLTQSQIVSSASIAGLVDQEIEYVIHPILPRPALVMLQGPPKKGKSAFALHLAISASKGVWPSGTFEIKKPTNVLFIEFEDAPILVAKRMSKFIRGIDIGHNGKEFPENLFFCSFPDLPLDSERHAELLIREIEKLEIGLIVIDTLSFVHRAESENSSADMKSIMAALKRIAVRTNSCVLILHHSAKGSDDRDGVEKGRGSSAIAAAPDVILDWGNRKKTNRTPVQVFSKVDDGEQDFIVEYKKLGESAVEWEISHNEDDENKGPSQKDEVLKAIESTSVANPSGVLFTKIYTIVAHISPQIVRRLIGHLERDGFVGVDSVDGRGSPKKVWVIRKAK